jgi:hypothetical protein
MRKPISVWIPQELDSSGSETCILVNTPWSSDMIEPMNNQTGIDPTPRDDERVWAFQVSGQPRFVLPSQETSSTSKNNKEERLDIPCREQIP